MRASCTLVPGNSTDQATAVAKGPLDLWAVPATAAGKGPLDLWAVPATAVTKGPVDLWAVPAGPPWFRGGSPGTLHAGFLSAPSRSILDVW